MEKRMKESFLVKVVGKLGCGANDHKELCIINRVVRWTPPRVYNMRRILAMLRSFAEMLRPLGVLLRSQLRNLHRAHSARMVWNHLWGSPRHTSVPAQLG